MEIVMIKDFIDVNSITAHCHEETILWSETVRFHSNWLTHGKSILRKNIGLTVSKFVLWIAFLGYLIWLQHVDQLWPVRYGNIPVINFHKTWCNLWDHSKIFFDWNLWRTWDLRHYKIFSGMLSLCILQNTLEWEENNRDFCFEDIF